MKTFIRRWTQLFLPKPLRSLNQEDVHRLRVLRKIVRFICRAYAFALPSNRRLRVPGPALEFTLLLLGVVVCVAQSLL